MDASLIGNRERVVALEKNLANASAEVRSFTAQHTADKYLLDGVRMALDIHNKALQQHSSAPTKDNENLLANKLVVEA